MCGHGDCAALLSLLTRAFETGTTCHERAPKRQSVVHRGSSA
ncbi:MAG: hypothetical protein JWL63_2460 [Rhodocyclales bacterium]|nr:hypothetical protein [Rhodocyclales bacterium]